MLDKKSSIYSGRPVSYVSDLMTHRDHLLAMDYGEKWRKFRKLIHQQFHESRCEKEHIVLQNAEAVQMLRDFCLAPGEVMKHPKRFSNSITMTLGKFGLEYDSIPNHRMRSTDWIPVQCMGFEVRQLIPLIL